MTENIIGFLILIIPILIFMVWFSLYLSDDFMKWYYGYNSCEIHDYGYARVFITNEKENPFPQRLKQKIRELLE